MIGCRGRGISVIKKYLAPPFTGRHKFCTPNPPRHEFYFYFIYFFKMEKFTLRCFFFYGGKKSSSFTGHCHTVLYIIIHMPVTFYLPYTRDFNVISPCHPPLRKKSVGLTNALPVDKSFLWGKK